MRKLAQGYRLLSVERALDPGCLTQNPHIRTCGGIAYANTMTVAEYDFS